MSRTLGREMIYQNGFDIDLFSEDYEKIPIGNKYKLLNGSLENPSVDKVYYVLVIR